MSSQSTAAAVPVRPTRAWYQSWLVRLVFGGAMMVVGLCQMSRGLHEFGGAANYGTLLKVTQSDLYYTSAVSKADAERLGRFLVESKTCGEKQISMQLTKSGSTLQFRLVVNPGVDKDGNKIATMQAMGALLSAQVFGGAPLEVQLCDDHFRTLRVVPATKTSK